MHPKLLLLVPLACAVLLPGCVLAALGVGAGAVMVGSAAHRDAYGRYRADMERLNFDRERAGLPPSYIMSYEQWDTGRR